MVKTGKNLLIGAFICAAFCLTAINTDAQTFKKGDFVLNAGIGLGSRYVYTNADTKIPPVSVSADFGIVDNLFNVDKLSLGVGGYFGMTSCGYTYSYGSYHYDWSWSYYIVGARGTIHYAVKDNFEVYGAVMLGYEFITYPSDYTLGGDNSDGDFFTGAVAGARYNFTKNFGVFAEVGAGIAWLNAGLSIKF
jgi:hypothetical protein